MCVAKGYSHYWCVVRLAARPCFATLFYVVSVLLVEKLIKMSRALARQLGKTLRMHSAPNLAVPAASYHEKVGTYVVDY